MTLDCVCLESSPAKRDKRKIFLFKKKYNQLDILKYAPPFVVDDDFFSFHFFHFFICTLKWLSSLEQGRSSWTKLVLRGLVPLKCTVV